MQMDGKHNVHARMLVISTNDNTMGAPFITITKLCQLFLLKCCIIGMIFNVEVASIIEVDKYVKTAGVKLTLPYRTETRTSRVRCCSICSQEKSCGSISHRSSTNECSLTALTSLQIPTHSVSDTNWDTYSKTGAAQWTLVFRGTAGIGTDVHAAWLQGTGTTSDDINCMRLDSTCTKHYRNTLVDSWGTINVQKVRLSYYRNGTEEAYIVFTGTPGLESWFSQNKMIDSSWTDMTSRTFNYFSIAGHPPSRVFFINVSYAGCGNDVVYTVTLTFQGHPCPYDFHASYPQFLFSRLNVATSDGSSDFVKADFIAISIQT